MNFTTAREKRVKAALRLAPRAFEDAFLVAALGQRPASSWRHNFRDANHRPYELIVSFGSGRSPLESGWWAHVTLVDQQHRADPRLDLDGVFGAPIREHLVNVIAVSYKVLFDHLMAAGWTDLGYREDTSQWVLSPPGAKVDDWSVRWLSKAGADHLAQLRGTAEVDDLILKANIRRF